MVDENLKRSVIQDVTLLKLVGFKPIIVHGGGKEISRWVGKVGMEPKFINGLRVTDEETMEIAEMVLGKVGQKSGTAGGGAGRQGSGHQRQGRRPSAGREEILQGRGHRFCR